MLDIFRFKLTYEWRGRSIVLSLEDLQTISWSLLQRELDYWSLITRLWENGQIEAARLYYPLWYETRELLQRLNKFMK